MKLHRKQFIGTGAALGILMPVAGSASPAPEFSYKLAHDVPPGHPAHVHLTAAAARIGEGSGGRIEIAIYPNNQLGGASAELSQTRLGAIDFALTNNADIGTIVPVTALTFIPFAFATEADASNAVDGAFGNFVRQAIVAANLNVRPVGKMWSSGFRSVSNVVRPILTPADIKGLKIRVAPGPISVDTFKGLGAIPTPVDGSAIYTAMQTHLVDGGDVTIVAMDSNKFFEVQRYLSLTNHQWGSQTLLANSNSFARLPQRLQNLVEAEFSQGATLERSDIAKNDAGLRKTLEARGLLINGVDVDPFRAALRTAGLYLKWRDQYGTQGWSALERAVGKLA